MFRKWKTLQLHGKSFNKRKFVVKRSQHQTAVAVKPEPKYPPIIDTSPEGLARHQRQLWYDSLKVLPTVDQKLYEITNNRSFFERTYMVSSLSPTYLGVPFQRYITRTHLLQGLPVAYQSMCVDEEYNKIKEDLPQVVASYFSNTWRQSKLNSIEDFTIEKECGAKLTNALISLVCKAFAEDYPHLLECAFDPVASLRSYWYHGGFLSPKNKLNQINLCFQFTETPLYTVRTRKPLPAIVPINDPLCSTPEVVDYNYQPSVFGIPYKQRYYINGLPGFWPGDPCDFPLLQVHTADRVAILSSKLDHFDLKTIEDGYGVMASFGWLNGLATYQGFTPYHDLTYPIVGHTILTDGKDWTFFVYQLNTICFHSDVDQKDKRNLCWTSGKMTLFETIENGEMKGVNEEVFKLLLKLILMKPDTREDIILKPYLGTDTRTEEEIKIMREAAIQLYRNAPGPTDHLHEIPMWQHVYKRHRDAPPSPWIKLE